MISTAAAALLAMAGTAFAAVTFDSEFGTGFVGKGDVQNAFGWNNKQLQDRASGVTFRFEETVNYPVTCTWITGPDHNQTVHNQPRTATSGVDSSIAYDARQRNQINGFNLNGWTSPEPTGGEPPEIGDNCAALGIDVNPNAEVTAIGTPQPQGSGLYVLAPGYAPFLIWP